MASRRKIEANKENLKRAIEVGVKKAWISKSCEWCKGELMVRLSAIKKGWRFCSWSCRVEGMRGSKAPNYGGGAWMKGTSNPNYKNGNGYASCRPDEAELKKWRRLVYERDGYRCVRCGYDKGKTLQAHHIHPYSEYPELRHDLTNGVTLCKQCHAWVHSKKNTNKDYIKCK